MEGNPLSLSTLQAVVRGNESNPGIYYEFTLPAVNVSAGRQHQWRLSNWTACSASCGGGVQHREPICQENGKGRWQEEEDPFHLALTFSLSLF